MEKYVRVMDGTTSNAGEFEYKIDEINISDCWNPQEVDHKKIGGFYFSTEDKILRWLHRGDTIYDVIIPEDAEIILLDAEKGIWVTNKIIVENPQIITDEKVMELYKKTTLSNKILAQCLQILLWKNRLGISQYIIQEKVDKTNVEEFMREFESFVSKTGKFNYAELSEESRIIYDMLINIKIN